MTIRKKSWTIITVFSILVCLNAIGFFYALDKIKTSTTNLNFQAEVTKSFLDLRYLLKNLQEISTDIALIGDKEDLKEIEKVEKEYQKKYKYINSMMIDTQTKKRLTQINSSFLKFITLSKQMAQAGVLKIDSKNESIIDMEKFDNQVTKLENKLDKLEGLDKYLLLQIKFNIKSIQEVLTDALAVGDVSGFKEVDDLLNELTEQLFNIMESKPNLEDSISSLNDNLLNVVSSGKIMAKKGEDFKINFYKTNSLMEDVDTTYNSMKSIINTIVKKQNKLLVESEKTNMETIKLFEKVLIALTIIFILSVIFLITTIRNILSNIQKLDYAVEGLANSNETSKVQIMTKDEIGNIAKNFNTYIEKIHSSVEQDKEVIKEAKQVMGKVNSGLYNDRIHKKASSIEVISLIDTINNMIGTTQKNLTTISDVLITLANAKYDETIPHIEGSTGLISSVLDGTRVTQSTINEVMALIDNSNKRLTFSADDLSKASSNLSKSSKEQAAALEETAAAIEEVTSAIEGTSQNTVKMSQYAQNVTNSSKVGIELATKTSKSMDELNNEVNTINEAISVIDQIAFQTNILSLNAAVEAATAGEAGKGFAVVAGEVRNLASRSAEAANEIKKLVESATIKAKEGKNVSTQMIEGFNELNSDITNTITLIDDVTTATSEQQEAMTQINHTINSLDQETQKNASLSAQISDMARSTKELALQLQAAVDRTSFSKDAKRKVCDTNMIFDLNKLKSDHINFKNTNFCMCKAGNSFTVKHYTECDMGKWLIANENAEFAQTQLWEDLKNAHKKVHNMVQDTVDLYSDEYENGQIIAVTESLEEQISKVFNLLDNLKEHNCDLKFKKR